MRLGAKIAAHLAALERHANELVALQPALHRDVLLREFLSVAVQGVAWAISALRALAQELDKRKNAKN